MSPEELVDAARILDALADDVTEGTLTANVRDIRYLRGAAAALRVAADE